MGDHEGWAQPGDLLPSGLLPNGEVYVNRRVDNERWSLAEERTAELITRIQPNEPSEELRNAVADYVQRLVMRCISCQVFTFGSVPLKTYLPDGDIDLTAFGTNEALRDTWANEVHIMLENEEKNENAEFRVKEVKPIQAEVKLIKCLVENIVVDISFNQVGGLCTLCFLEEVDHLINQNHLFKRSIILIKAWCYYESRILGAHHGLISTYALETLVLYIFHVFNNSFSGPLEVLYRFLEFFSNFDWENYCVSLWGPVPIRSLPDMTAESPRKDNGELLLKKLFLESCVAVYAVGGQENQGPFVSKYFNVIDPLRTSNNLGRSVNKGNFFRIRSAFGFGAKRLARLLDCPKEDIITEVNQFFMNTWERHGTGHRPDAPTASLLRLHRLNFGHHNMPENRRNQLSSNRNNENSTGHESDGYHTFHETSYQHGNEGTARTSSMPSVSHKQSQKYYGNGTGSKVSDPVAWNVNSSQRVNNEKAQEIPKPGYLVKDGHDKYQFVRTRSSPELLNNSTEISSRGRRHRALDMGKTHIDSVRSDNSSRKKNSSSEFPYSNNTRSSVNDPSSFRHTPSHQRFDTSNNSNNASNYYHDEAGLNTLGEELSSLNETMERHQEQQDLVNMMASSGFHGFNAQVQMPMNIGTSRLPFPISPSVLASMAYAQRNMPGMIPGSIPLVDPHWGTNIQFPQGMVPSSLSHYFPSMRLTSNPEEMIDPHSVNQELTVSQEHSDQDIWNEDGVASTRDFSDVNGSTHTRQFEDKQYSASTGHNFASSSRNSSGSSSTRNQHNSDKESRRLVRDGLVREDLDDTIHHKKNRGSEGHSTERIANLRSLTTSHTSSSRSRASSESSWDESSVKVSKSTRDKRGRKPAPSTVFGENKSGSQYERVSIDQGSPRADDGIRDWIPLSTMGSEMAGPNAAGSSHSRSQQLPNYDSAQMNVSESLLPIAPMVLGSGSRQGPPLDNSRVLPFTFFPTGPPVPFLTMLPVYNFATNTGNSDGSSSHFDKEEEETDSSHMYQSEQNINSAECLDQLENLSINSMKNEALSEHLEEQKHDILDSDFSSHWQNLQYGRFCQNPRHHGPLFYHSPVMVPPMYLQGNFQWDGPGRPNSSNGNLISPVTGYGHRLVPVTPLQPSSSRPAGVYQRFGDEMPRYRGGTGTYLPNTKVTFRDRQSSSSRSQRGNYNYDHNDHVADRDGNWNNSKPRYSGRHYNRTQSEKGSSRSDRLATNDNRANRSWEPYRHESFPAHHSQNGSIGSSASVQNGPTNGVHGVYPSQAVNSNGIAPSGTGAPPVLMLYSYDPNGGYGSNADQVEFGSLHRPHLSSVSEIPQHGEGYLGRGAHGQQRFRGNSALSSPDQPSSPQFKR